jgi:hypothetical protein
MFRIPLLWFFPLASVFLMAADSSGASDSSWKRKSLAQWSDADARQILTDSPWVKYVTPETVRDLSAAERRDGGDMEADIGHGVGIAGTGILGPARAREAIARAHEKPPNDPVMVRWESALPVRAAEQKAGEREVPVLDGDDYALAIYNIPYPRRWNEGHELKGVAFLKRDNKKDIKPSRVKILRHDDDTVTLVYLFPRSVEIAKKDGRVQFQAQVGRLVVSQNFFTQDMQFQGELQLLMPSETPVK